MTPTTSSPSPRRPLPWPWLSRRGLRWLAIGYVLLVAGGWSVAYLHGTFFPEWQTAGADATVVEILATDRDPTALQVLQTASLLGKIWVVAPVVALVGLLVWRRTGSWDAFWLPAVAGGGGFAISVAVKYLTARPRPPLDLAAVEAFGPSYPSGHVIRVTAVYAAMAWLVAAWTRRRAVRSTAWLTAALVVVVTGFARLYEAAHWLIDVVVGAGIGLGWLLVVLLAGQLVPYGGSRRAPRSPADGARGEEART